MTTKRMISEPIGYSANWLETEYNGDWRLIQRYYLTQDVLEFKAEKCTKGGKCVIACPKEALEIKTEDGELELVFYPEKCVLCGICSSVCIGLDIGALDKRTESFGPGDT